MDRQRRAARILIASVFVAGLAFADANTPSPLRAARWLPVDRQQQALTQEPSECLAPATDAKLAQRIAIGRAAFRTPLLLGGQAARAGLACNSCHRNGRGNPDFAFPGLSGAPGTADVTSSLMSSHRGDGRSNPVAIPDLSGAASALKISREPSSRALETFIHGLIVEEFDGPEPTAATLDGLASYVRALSPTSCPSNAQRSIRLGNMLSDTRAATLAAQASLTAKDPATARLMLASARSMLGLIDERYATAATAHDRDGLREADRELAQIQAAIDSKAANGSLRLTAWLAAMPRWVSPLERDEALSLFNAERLKQMAAN
ncbi:MAG TPA: hypothetical protein VKM35_00325 [Arenimonas sp.]|uniref:hypothetical protein n=1 Tax=Arenimonas sp. TaxID=1872635 RepID=UPI002B79B259|nr:hypothetical protein [Arenimonas sp.]HMB55636.1 hypothetical protein [Arenimonas sp.]